ncbi:MAG TPA: hypothetical protein VFZ69_06260 [Longimicrobiales bacterium]
MDRILLISGDIMTRESTLRRKVLRFTGSRHATRVILKRIASAQRLGQIMSCMVVPRAVVADADYGDETGWDVRISYAAAEAHGGVHA